MEQEESGGRKVRGKEKDKGASWGQRTWGEVKVGVPGGGGQGRAGGAGGRGPAFWKVEPWGQHVLTHPPAFNFPVSWGFSFIFGKAACSVTNLFLNKPSQAVRGWEGP